MDNEDNSVWSAIKSAIVDVFRKTDQLEAVEKQEFRPYSTLQISLATARVDAEFNYKGTILSVIRNEGEAIVRLNEKDNDELDLSILEKITAPYYRFFLTNGAQAGKSLTLAFGRDVAFTPTVAQGMTTTIRDKSYIKTGTAAAAGSGGVYISLDNSNAKMILIHSIAAQIADTGNAASYLAIEYHDGTDFVELKRNTGAEPKLYWDGAPLVDRGFLLIGELTSRIRVTWNNAGGANKAYKIIWNYEKVG